MWYDDLGIISIGAQCGGPEDGDLGHIKVNLYKAFRRHCLNSYCPAINHYALLLRVDGQFQTFGPEGIGKVRRNKRENYIQAEIVIIQKTWESHSKKQLKSILADRVRQAIVLCTNRLRKDRETIDDANLLKEVDAAISEFINGE